MGDVVSYLLDNGEIPLGALALLLALWAALHYGLPFLRRSERAHEPVEERASDHARVQRTTVGDIRADGDVDIRPRQE